MPLRWGIIGCGNVAEFKGGPALYRAPGSELVAVMRRDLAAARDFAARHGARRAYGSVADLLADDEVDAVYIATPPALHAEQTLAAAAAGKHVLCEKPMALTVRECVAMVEACRKAGVMLSVAYYRRFWPLALRMKALLDAGDLGQVTMARVTITGLYYPPADGSQPWRVRPEVSGGGLLADVGSHRIDLLIHLLGDVVEVSALTSTITFDLAVEDSASLILRFASRAQGVLACHWNVAAAVDDLEVAGTGGRLLASPFDGGLLHTSLPAGAEQTQWPRPEITHLPLVERFIAAVNGEGPNPLSGEEGMKTTAVLEAAYLASARRCAVNLGDLG